MAEATVGLLPCPFCGGEVKMSRVPGGHMIHCEPCGVTSDDGHAGRIVAKWNRRASLAQDAAPVASVEAIAALYGEFRAATVEPLPGEAHAFARSLFARMSPPTAATIRAEARREAMEEAAKIGEAIAKEILGEKPDHDDGCGWEGALEVVDAIRASAQSEDQTS